MKFSIITATFNRENIIPLALDSLYAQTLADFEHLIIDGGSTDKTLAIVEAQAHEERVVISEPDDGIYDALNKGCALATGEVIGLLHSDDFFASPDVLALVAQAFRDPEIDAVYGDLHYVSKNDPQKIIRDWRSGEFRPELLRRGWMPPHPALFLRRRVIERHGAYDTNFRIAADYDAILRYFSQPGFRAVYIPEVFVKMRVGGESNRSVERVLRKSLEDYRALRKNNVGGLGALLSKNTSKIRQFLPRT